MADHLFIVEPGFLQKVAEQSYVQLAIFFKTSLATSVHARNSWYLLFLVDTLTLVSSTSFLRCQYLQLPVPYDGCFCLLPQALAS